MWRWIDIYSVPRYKATRSKYPIPFCDQSASRFLFCLKKIPSDTSSEKLFLHQKIKRYGVRLSFLCFSPPPPTKKRGNTFGGNPLLLQLFYIKCMDVKSD